MDDSLTEDQRRAKWQERLQEEFRASLIRLSEEYYVPGSFGSSVLARDRDTGEYLKTESGQPLELEATVTMVDGRPRLGHVTTEEFLAPATWQKIDFNLLATHVLLDFMKWGLDEDERQDALAVAEGAVRKYNRLTYQDKERIVRLAEAGGPEAVAKGFHVGRRQASRYIADARKAVQR